MEEFVARGEEGEGRHIAVVTHVLCITTRLVKLIHNLQEESEVRVQVRKVRLGRCFSCLPYRVQHEFSLFALLSTACVFPVSLTVYSMCFPCLPYRVQHVFSVCLTVYSMCFPCLPYCLQHVFSLFALLSTACVFLVCLTVSSMCFPCFPYRLQHVLHEMSDPVPGEDGVSCLGYIVYIVFQHLGHAIPRLLFKFWSKGTRLVMFVKVF